MIATRSPSRDTAIKTAATELSALLALGRAYLASIKLRVCPVCSHVFSPDARLDMRCPACADAAAAHADAAE